MTHPAIAADPVRPGRDRGSLLAIGFGTSVLVWAVAYAGLAPYGEGHSVGRAWLVLAVAGLLAMLAGWLQTRLTAGGLAGAAKLGLVLTGINFLIVASLNGRDTTVDALLSGLLWIVGFGIAAIVLCVAGASLAGFRETSRSHRIQWTSIFAMVVAVTTLPLLISGGIVTGLEAGMAVPDWLTTFDYPMMFYPMVKMQEDTGVYAEHFHRLWGLLVGLSVVALVIHVHLVERRRWVRRLSIAVLALVIVQGVLGGTRVTENILALAIVHGVFAQAVFAIIVGLAAVCSITWTSDREPEPSEQASIDIRITTALPLLFLLQLVLGALYRHLNAEVGVQTLLAHSLLTVHVLVACVLAVAVVVPGMRMMGFYGTMPILPKLGIGLLLGVGLQLLLGVAAMITVLLRSGEGGIPMSEVIVTTAHQTTGAILLAMSVVLGMWVRRLVVPAGSRAAERTTPMAESA